MKIKLENIGIIEKADIKLNGLTVIAGENDTGKSFVGKTLFALIKAFNIFEQVSYKEKDNKIYDTIERIYFKIKRNVNFRNNSILRTEFSPQSFFHEIHFKNINQIIDYKRKFIKDLEIHNKEKDIIIQLLKDLETIILKTETKEESIKKTLSRILRSEFHSEINNKLNNSKAKIEYLEGENISFQLEIENNDIIKLDYDDELYFNDVTFIETPIILQMYDLINYSNTMFDKNYDSLLRGSRRPISPFHIKDLITKLETIQYPEDILSITDNDLANKISNLINGNMLFDKKKKDFIFNKKQDIKIKSLNTATGIKSFGIIQLLLYSDILNDRNLLIIDEPEIHLHPEWQVEYAKFIIELVKNDITVLITSHSPYMIQALRFFSEKEEITEKTSYYLTEQEESDYGAIISDVSDELDRIFEKLAIPMEKLVWG